MKNVVFVTASAVRALRREERNKTVMKRALIGAALFILHSSFFAFTCQAQSEDSTKVNKLTLGLNFLAHGEICAGGLPKPSVQQDVQRPEESFSAFLLGRTRISLGYERKWLEAKAVIQNLALWGMKSNMSLNLYEGWVKMKAKCGLFTQLGRIALSYDDERIIGTNDFATASLSHDVALVGYEGHGHKLHGIFAFNQNIDNLYAGTYYVNGSQHYKTMQTAWYHYDFPKIPLGASLLFMNVGLQAGEYKVVKNKMVEDKTNPPHVEYQQMYGTYVNFHPKYLTLEGSYYRQSGQVLVADMHTSTIKAWMASGKATVKPTDRYGFELGYDYLSGDDFVPVTYGGTMGLPLHSVEGGFTPLYGSRTKFYGIMDYFYESAYTNGFTPGLQNAYVSVIGEPVPKLRGRIAYHYMAVATSLNNLSSTLGHSMEINARYDFSKDVSLSAGYTLMVGTETMNRLKHGTGSKQAHWAWFSLIVSPTIFTTRF